MNSLRTTLSTVGIAVSLVAGIVALVSPTLFGLLAENHVRLRLEDKPGSAYAEFVIVDTSAGRSYMADTAGRVSIPKSLLGRRVRIEEPNESRLVTLPADSASPAWNALGMFPSYGDKPQK